MKTFWVSAVVTLIGLAAIVGLSCYKPGPMPPPCVNIMNCDDPTTPPWPPPDMRQLKRDGGADAIDAR